MQNLIQRIIHLLEVGAGARYLRYIALAAAVVALGVLYDVRAARNFSTLEAMDTAQLAHNIADGQGYTTKFIRPFSLYLIQKHKGVSLTDTNSVPAQMSSAHPDLANPPVYPVMLAGLMKVFTFNFNAETKRPFWSDGARFQRFQPEFLIAIFNEVLLLIAVLLTFLLAKNLFDSNIAWLSAILVLGCEQLWRFSVAGLSTVLLLNIFLGLTLCLLVIDRSAREAQPARKLILFSVFAGALVGIGALTRYSFGWMIIPVTFFLILFSGEKKWIHSLIAFATFMIFLMPWVIRNEMVSGTLFGTAGYAAAENAVFSKFQLERSLHPNLTSIFWVKPYINKLLNGLRGIFSDDLPKLGGSWAAILFLAGLLLNFRSIGARRIRYFLLMSLGFFICVQTLGRTALSDESAEINSENLLMLFAPVVFIFGASFFFTLLDQMNFAWRQLRYVVTGIFTVFCCLPMLFSLVMKSSPLVYPPYYPPEIQTISGWMKDDELIMSDVPWAVAWYGNRPCVWLTLDAQDEFTLASKIKPVQTLYLTAKTTDGRFLSDWMESRDRSWGNFIYQTLTEKRLPSDFPLTKMPTGYFPERIVLSDKQRW